jgi:uncharacterized protein YrrD
MKEIKALIGTPILISKTHEKCGVVLDVIIDMEKKSIVSLIVSDSNPACSLPFFAITSFADTAILIEDSSSIVGEDADPLVHASLSGRARLKGSEVKVQGADTIGHVGDYFFDPANGEIIGYETMEARHEFIPFGPSPDIEKSLKANHASAMPKETSAPVGPEDPAAPETLEDKKQEARELFSHIAAPKQE